MPTQRLDEKRVEARTTAWVSEWQVGVGGEDETEGERGRKRKSAQKTLWLLLLYVFSSALCKLGLARSAVCST